MAPTVAEIDAARERLAGVARETPLYHSETFSRLSGRRALLKAENLQRTGSFKIRGAYNTISTLGPEQREAGVVAASAGNHGQAVAWAARVAGIPATIFMPEDAPMAKVEATRSYGGVVELAGEGFEGAVAAAQAHVERGGATLVHAFEDERVIAGQGTIGLELAEQAAEAETVLIPVGGGGLAAGISIALRERRPGQRIVGVTCRPGLTIADGISVKHRGELASSILERTLDDWVEVSDEEISDALVLALERKKLLLEGAGAACARSAPHGPRRRLRAGRRRPLGREHRRDDAHLGRAARAHAGRPLPRRADADPGPAGRAAERPRPRRARAWQRRLRRPPPRGNHADGAADGGRARRLDPRRGALRRDPRDAPRRRLRGRASRPTGVSCARCKRARGAGPRTPGPPSSAPSAARRSRRRSGTRREERKVVSVVFADLVGSTARADGVDPEDVLAILAPYHERLRHELERHGGSVEKFIGDAVVGVFGAPVAHEDDAERAVRAALAIQTAIAELNEADASLQLEVRIGVNTGEALVSLDPRSEAGEAMVTGDVMNTGARLQAAAPPGGVLVADATYRATSREIEYSEVAPVVAKGKAEPMSAWIAVASRSRFGVDVFQTGRAPLIGRQRELELLAAALARARAEREPQLVTLVGVPGIGKSRLVYEVWRIVDDDPDLIVWRQGRSLPYGDGVAYWALGEIVKAQAGILESEDALAAGEKLAAAMSDLLSADEARWVERHLRPLVGLAAEADPGEGRRAEAFAAWRRFFEALAERTPTVLVFEDMQWADEGLLEFLDGLVERVTAVPLLVICSTRPELLERRSGWGGGKRNSMTISLAPLSDDDTSRLLAALLDRPVLPAEEQAVLLQRAGGNPLYAEEYARMLETEGLPGDVPETLQGVVAARIDALPADEKELLQRAAVFGKVFWTDALAAVLETDEWLLEERLHALERKEFVRRERRSAVADARQYVFVHALVRDGAYGQLPRAARSRMHEAVADWIDSLPPDRAEDRAEMFAHHLLQAVEYGRAADRDVGSILPKAARAARDAGDRAWALAAPGRALERYEQARALDPALGEDPYLLLRLGQALVVMIDRGQEELEAAAAALADSDPAAAAAAEVARGELAWQRGDRDGSFPYFERAAATVEGLPPSNEKLVVLNQLSRFYTLAGRNAEGLALAEEAIVMAEKLEDRDVLGDTLNTRGLARMALGDLRGIADVESSVAVAVEMNSWRAGRAFLNLGSSLFITMGDVVRGDAALHHGWRAVEAMGLPVALRWFRTNIAETAFHLGHWEEALELAIPELADPEPHYMQPVARIVRARIRLVRDDVRGALVDAERAADESRAIRDPQAILAGLAAHAFCAASAGDKEAASATVAELLDEVDRLGPESGLAGPWVTELAFALHELGREAELAGADERLGPAVPWRNAALAISRGEAVAAADILRDNGALAFEAHARLCAARRLTAEGRHADAEAQLAPALAFYRGVGASAAVREGEALLAAAS